ncbi:MAG: peroxidase, partial [Proteobacteria bacterium]
FMANNDLKDLYYSFGRQVPGQLVLNNFPKFMQELKIPGHGVMDLGMVDIMRDRERGVPRYNQFRRGIGLKPITSYKDFFPPGKPLDDRQMQVLQKFYKVYGKDTVGNDNVEMIDLLVGTLSEEVRPKNFGFGETMFQIFILMASRRLMADRFFTEDYTDKYYTRSGKDWIDHEGTLAQIIVRHMPELKSKVQGLETAFLPWNE